MAVVKSNDIPKHLFRMQSIHDVETSMAPHYKERIVSYQNYLGQVRLFRSEEVANRQTALCTEFAISVAHDVCVTRGAKTASPRHTTKRLRGVSL